MENQSQHSSFHLITNRKIWAKLLFLGPVGSFSVGANLFAMDRGRFGEAKWTYWKVLERSVMRGLHVLTKGVAYPAPTASMAMKK